MLKIQATSMLKSKELGNFNVKVKVYIVGTFEMLPRKMKQNHTKNFYLEVFHVKC